MMFKAIVSFFRLRNTLTIDNFHLNNQLKTNALVLFVKSLWSFFFDNMSFGFVVVFIYKTVNPKIAQVNTPLHLIWQYIMANSILYIHKQYIAEYSPL